MSSSQANFFSVSSVALRAGDKIHGEQIEEAFYSMASLAEDVYIVTGDKGSVKVNRALLCIFSPTLRQIFTDIPCCISPTIFLPDCSTSSLKHLLSLITTGVTTNDKIVPKDVIAAAGLLCIQLKNIVRGTLNQNPKSFPMNSKNMENDLLKRKPADIGENQNGKKLCLKFSFTNKSDNIFSSAPQVNPISPQLQPISAQLPSIASQLQSVFPHLQPNTLNFDPALNNRSLVSDQPLSAPSLSEQPTSVVDPMPSPASSMVDIRPSQLANENKIPIHKPESLNLSMPALLSNMDEPKLKDPIPIDITKECQICHEKETKLSLLWRHYYVKHVYKELKTKFEGKIVNNGCPSCQTKFPTLQAVLLHLGRSHSEINRILTEKGLKPIPNEDAKDKNKYAQSVPSLNKVSPLGSTNAKLDVIKSEPIFQSIPCLHPFITNITNVKISQPTTAVPLPSDFIKSEPIGCQMCDQNYFRNVDDLWQHYCASHFYEELKAEFGSFLKGKVCISCNEKFATRPDAARHIGIKHQKVNYILKLRGLEELSLPTIKKLPSTQTNYYLVDIEKDKISLEAREPKINSVVDLKVVDLETNKTLNDTFVHLLSDKKVKTKYSEEQEYVLKEAFSEDQNLTTDRKNTLAIALELTEDEVENWFKETISKLVESLKSVKEPEIKTISEEPVEPVPSAKQEFLNLEFEADPELPENRRSGLALALGLTQNQVSEYFKAKSSQNNTIKKISNIDENELTKYMEDIFNAKASKLSEDISGTTNEEERIFQCEHCEKSFLNKKNLDKHSQKHSDTISDINNDATLAPLTNMDLLNHLLQQKIDSAKDDNAKNQSEKLQQTNDVEQGIQQTLVGPQTVSDNSKDKKKKKVTKYPEETVKILRKEFDMNEGILAPQRKKSLASELGLTENQVKNWYINRRRVLKTRKTEVNSNISPLLSLIKKEIEK